MQTLWLARHASTAMTGNRWAGSRSDPPLTDEGRTAAADLAARLFGRLPAGTIVVSSPSRRAVETAEPIAAALRVDVEIDDDLREVDVGELEGRTFDEGAALFPELAQRLLAAEREIDWPGGERAADLRARSAAALGRLEGRSADEAVVVSHGGVIGELIVTLAGPDALEDRWIAAGSAVSLERSGDGWRVAERVP
ncbi:MAG TPA: histidine phosphatase family protein [Candidatus Limnocylindrales bacterium]|nr:histidine phosphatase family protein [Candidatus Limnocylindrales bacterium]